MREVKLVNVSTGEVEGKQDFCSLEDMLLSPSLQEGLQRAQTRATTNNYHLLVYIHLQIIFMINPLV